MARAGIELVDEVRIDESGARYADPPSLLSEPIAEMLREQFPDGIYSHQQQALGHLLGGDDVCLSTQTGSGKTLVFAVMAADLVLKNPGTKVIAMYPARALVQDQVAQWDQIAKSMNLRVSRIDGGIPRNEREQILEHSDILLITPDVVHAWMMARLDEPPIQQFLHAVALVVLDEAHVYEGAFGTNMAYLMRRLGCAVGDYTLVVSTATIGRPAEFIELLTGKEPVTLGPEVDGSHQPSKDLLLGAPTKGNSFASAVTMLHELANQAETRFIAFGDSRRMVERMVAALHERKSSDSPDARNWEVLPYRAGYEKADREDIQRALTEGSLSGVVATSALELGIDIGDLDHVVLLNPPPGMKALWQRFGRAGRRRPAACVLLDAAGLITATHNSWKDYLEREVEPSWLYLPNRVIQYANAICAASELKALNVAPADQIPFHSLPEDFIPMVQNEIDQAEMIPQDLFPIKQRSAGVDPHFEFPLRTGTDTQFEISGPGNTPMGDIGYGQALLEAYPGAVYLYMGRPHRVHRFVPADKTIHLRKEKRGVSTEPRLQTMVFPDFASADQIHRVSAEGFAVWTQLQVSQRLTGFVDTVGGKKTEHVYGTGSPYSQREITKFFKTTGVAWYFPDARTVGPDVASAMLNAFCDEYGIHSRDVGVGTFYSRSTPFDIEKCHGICIFDATDGSLRLTDRLIGNLEDVAGLASARAKNLDDQTLANQLTALEQAAHSLSDSVPFVPGTTITPLSENVARAVKRGSVAMFVNQTGAREFTVAEHRFTPQGLMYLADGDGKVDSLIPYDLVQPIAGVSEEIMLDLMTMEESPIPTRPRHPVG